jgi:crotonobetainyl-CoA:carnitine CoA-transferase CaiB-like acyl-CoA transferase
LNRLGAVVGLEGIAEIAVTQLGTELESRFASASAEQWVSEIRAAGVSAHILVNYKENMESQLAKDRGLSILRTHPGIGQTRNVGPLVPCLINTLAGAMKSGGGVPPPARPEAAPTLVRSRRPDLHPTAKELTRHGTSEVLRHAVASTIQRTSDWNAQSGDPRGGRLCGSL